MDLYCPGQALKSEMYPSAATPLLEWPGCSSCLLYVLRSVSRKNERMFATVKLRAVAIQRRNSGRSLFEHSVVQILSMR